MISNSKLDFWIENRQNVLLIGRHGVGKTAAVISAFNRNNLKWKYFSVATMDPWVDFVGVPQPVTDPVKGITYLDLVRPKDFAEDEVEAIFLDEYNRGVDTVRNAALELIQFKSINGKKFNNLKIVWAAINPEDDISEYDVAKLDWAQKDRFHVHVEVPYELDKEYFANKYGTTIADNVHSWWTGLEDVQRNNVSPRRVDYMLQMYQLGGDLHDVVPTSINVQHLINTLSNGSLEARLDSIMQSNNVDAAIRILKNDTTLTEAMRYIMEDDNKLKYFIPLLSNERLHSLIGENIKNQDILKRIGILYDVSDVVRNALRSFYTKYETKDDIQSAIPFSHSDKWGRKVNEIKRLPFMNREPNEEIIQTINSAGVKRDITNSERKEIYQLILDKAGFNGKGKNGNASLCIIFVGKLLKQLEDEVGKDKVKEVLDRDYPDALGILNESLMGIDNQEEDVSKDMRVSSYWKMISKKIIELGLEEYVWIPN